MRDLLRRLFARAGSADRPQAPDEEPSNEIVIGGAPPFPIAQHVTNHNGFPIVDWRPAFEWAGAITVPEVQLLAWQACERNWLLRFRDALGVSYALSESKHVALLSSLPPRLARTTLQYLEHTLQRVVAILDGIAAVPQGFRDVLVLFDSAEPFYRYVSHYYPQSGEFPLSGGMYLSGGHPHFVIVGTDLMHLEPVIAHEMTHACVSHLPLPLWINEGLAVNTEGRIAGRVPRTESPRELHAKHLAFWNDERIQEYWSGHSFHRTDEGEMLSYELARTMVEQLSSDWPSFRGFVLAADARDAGAAAAREVFDIDLGALACALLEREPTNGWKPEPSRWQEASTTPQ